MELRKYLEVLLRRKLVFIVTLAVIFLTSVIGTFFMKPVYEAKAKLYVDSSDTLSTLMSSIGLGKSSAGASTAVSDTFDTEIALATLKPVLEKLISDLDLKDRDGKTIKTNKLMNYSIFSKVFPRPFIEIEQYKDSDLLQITSQSSDPEEAATMANQLADYYINDKVAYLRKEYKVAREFIEQKIKDIKGKYYESLSAKKDFMVKESTVDLQAETSNLLQYIDSLRKSLDVSDIEIAEADKSIMLIEEKLKGKSYASSNMANYVESKISDMLINISGGSIDITEEHPDLQQLNRQVETLKTYLEERTEIVFDSTEVSVAPIYEELVSSLKNAYINKKTSEIKRNLISRSIDKAQDELMKIPAKSIKQSDIELSLSVNQDTYKDLLNYLTNLSIAESITLSNVKLVEPAVAPARPDSPNKGLNYFLGIFMGTFWGIFFVFFLEYVDNTIKSQEDLSDYKYSLLGSVPTLKKDILVSKTDPNDPVYESYQKIVTGIHLATHKRETLKMMIGSIEPHAGSSVTAANLGILLAREGKKVLLVDADLRRPHLHNLFKLSGAKGVSEIILENAKAGELALDTGIERLSLLPSGSTPPDAGLLLKSDEMGDLIRELGNIFDIVLFHAAPLLIKNDAILLMKNLDDMVIVLEKGTSHNALQRAQEHLTHAKIEPIGVVLNKV